MSGYVGLDLSLSSTGFYQILDGRPAKVYEIDSRPGDFATDLERADAIARSIIDCIGDSRPDMIALEDYFVGKQANSAIKLVLLGTVVRTRLLEAGMGFITFSPAQIKKLETGSGTAPKDNMLKSVFKKHGLDTSSNNIADACAIAYAAKAYHEWRSGRRDFLKYETEVLKKVDKEREFTTPYSLKAGTDSRLRLRTV